MNLLLDTNIIVNIIRAKDYKGIINLINPTNSIIYISVVSEAEIKSIALRNNWGVNRRNLLDSFLDQVNIIDINQLLTNIYAEIDAYSQRVNPSFGSYPFATPRNMGKNDLWISSVAALLGLKLVTTDSDFDHLNNIFFEIEKMNAGSFVPFY